MWWCGGSDKRRAYHTTKERRTRQNYPQRTEGSKDVSLLGDVIRYNHAVTPRTSMPPASSLKVLEPEEGSEASTESYEIVTHTPRDAVTVLLSMMSRLLQQHKLTLSLLISRKDT